MFENSLDSFFKDEICWLFFQLNRKETEFSFHELSTRLKFCLRTIKRCLDTDPNSKYVKYLMILYKFIGFIRDNCNGLGEQYLSYVFIYDFYESYPELSLQSIPTFITPLSTTNQQFYFGCWKDIKQLCSYVFKKTNNKNHEIINKSVELLNQQLFQDWETWKFSANCFSNLHISNVSKFIPREKSKHGWLFELLAVHWIHTHKPYIFKFIKNDSSMQRAILKSKRIYRKIVSYLNKSLQTTEIYLCENKVSDLDIENISMTTANQHKNIFLQLNTIDNETTISTNFKQHIQDKLVNLSSSSQHKIFTNGSSFSKLSIYAIMQYVMQYYESDQAYSLDNLLFINSLWRKLYIEKINAIHKFQVIPLIDVSYSMDQSSLYNAIGLGILLSYISLYQHRIIAVDQQSTWFAFNPNALISDTISMFMESIYNMRNTKPDFENAICLILEGLKIQKNSPFIRDINIVILSNFQHSTINETTIENLFIQRGYTYFPKVIYWNLNESEYVDVPCATNSMKSFAISGYATSHLHFLHRHQKLSTFQYISHILSQERFSCFDNYIKQLLMPS